MEIKPRIIFKNENEILWLKIISHFCIFCVLLSKKKRCAKKTYRFYFLAREIIKKIVRRSRFSLCANEKKTSPNFFIASSTQLCCGLLCEKRNQARFKKRLFRFLEFMIVANETKESRLRSNQTYHQKKKKKSMWNIHKGRNSILYKSAHM